jgi:hypothetical protein
VGIAMGKEKSLHGLELRCASVSISELGTYHGGRKLSAVSPTFTLRVFGF